MPKSTKLYLAAVPLVVAGIVLSLLGDVQLKREHSAKTWGEASKETDGVSGIPGE